MSEHQKRIFVDMLKEVQKYSSGEITLSSCVAALEGMLQASEIKDKTVLNTWYDKWSPLEVANGYYSGTGKEPLFSELKQDVQTFQDYIIKLTMTS